MQTIPSDIHQQLQKELQAAQLRVVGHEDIFDIAEITLMIAVLRAYGKSKQGFLYAEPALPNAQVPPPDLVLAHPSLGVVVFECKAYDVDFLRGIEAGYLKIMRHGREERVNPLRQARRGMFAIKDTFEKFARAGPRPLFHAVVALPNIEEAEWKRLGYHRSMDGQVVLFQDQLQTPEKLKQRLGTLAQQIQRRTGATTPYPVDSESVLLRVFGDSAVINDARQTIRDLEPDSLGAQIDQMELAHKQLSAEQQRLSRVDAWGHPYLVRGVAGSGKSVVLANQVARTIYRHQKQRAQLSLFEDNERPIPRLGVICFNRSLVPMLRDRVSRAYQALTNQDLPKTLVITDMNRLLYQMAGQLGEQNFRYISVKKVRQSGERTRRHLEQLETLQRNAPDLLTPFCFDGLMIDEGQDAHPNEYALLRALVRPNLQTGERSIMIFYDDAQNLYGNPPPTWRELSLNVTGRRAAFMKYCYRNSREIIELGLNVLLGTQAHQRVRVATRRFVDIHTLLEKKLVKETPDGVRAHFAEEMNMRPQVRAFQSRYEQLDWVAEATVALLENEQVRPDHILILAPRSTPFRYLSERITQLLQKPIPLRLVGGGYRQFLDEMLIVPDHLTLATVHAAKGYDAPITFLIDTDLIEDTVLGRALFYVGVTRSKRYLMVTGLDVPNTLMHEALAVQNSLWPQ